MIYELKAVALFLPAYEMIFQAPGYGGYEDTGEHTGPFPYVGGLVCLCIILYLLFRKEEKTNKFLREQMDQQEKAKKLREEQEKKSDELIETLEEYDDLGEEQD